MEKPTTTRFECYDVALELIRSLKQPLEKLRSHDAALAEQARRAAQSIVLNIAEARRRVGKDRPHLFRVALGSAGEVRAAIDVACAWGWLADDGVTTPRALLDRVIAMLWRLGGG